MSREYHDPGSSGGALVDMHGELIGMNSAIAALVSADGPGTFRSGSIGIGFAIPVDHAERVARELITTGKATHGWLGVQASNDVNSHGARIIGVTDSSPAAEAGLSAGTLITKVDDHAIGSGEPGPITRDLQRVFDDALHGRDPRYAEWLDMVAVPTKAA